MSFELDHLHITISVEASQPQLLQGLDDWLRLGLIDDVQVQRLSRQYLSCPLPVQKAIAPVNDTPAEIPALAQTSVARPNFLLRAWQSFQEELSVRWLLFLGVFLVVVSSGVLAASQWQQFSAIGQYGILGIYTLAFWGVSFWARRQDLRITTRTMQLLFLLLVPINFWAMGTFGLWQNIWGWFVAAIASVSLTAIVVISSRQKRQLSFPLLTFLGLSYLQWGLGNSSFSLIAVYLGVTGTAAAIYLRSDSFGRQSNSLHSIGIGKELIVYALSVLLVRAIFVLHLPIQQLGLAIGICGWLLGRTQEDTFLAESQLPAKISARIGGIVLFLGWLVCVGEAWQAIAVSGLAIHWCYRRLRRYWLRRDLLAIFAIGLQALILVREIVPPQLGQAMLDFSIQVARSNTFPQSVYGITLFPYVVFFIWLNKRLGQEQPKLADFGEWLTLGLGIGLTAISSLNPTWRSLNLFLSSAALLYVTYYRSPRKALIYLTHLCGLLTIGSAIDWWFPSLNQLIWASILLMLMVAQWSIFISQAGLTIPFGQASTSTWYSSCWHFGLVLAGVGYVLLLEQVNLDNQWGFIWLLTPLALTGVARRRGRQRTEAAALSCIALVAAQFLTLWQPEARLIGLAVASGLMFFNTLYLRQSVVAAGHIGFALSLFAALVWGWLPLSSWFLAGAITIVVLWAIFFQLRQRAYPLGRLYARAADKWAVFLVAVELFLLPLHSLSRLLLTSGWEALIAIVLIGGAIVYRYWQQPNTLAIYSFGWAIELFVVDLILVLNGSLALATANIALALCSFWLIERLPRQFSPYSNKLASLPLLYAAIAIACRFSAFNAYTGFLVLGAAITGIRAGYRLNQKWLVAVSIVGISLAIYELSVYQLWQMRVSFADRLTILATVTAGMALAYRVFAWLWRRRGNDVVLNLSMQEVMLIAHFHWAIASLLKLLAASTAIRTPGFSPISIAISLILAAYALIQGRDRGSSRRDWWVYVGLVEIAATAVYARLIWVRLSILDPWRIILACAIALTIYQMPWRSFGWRQYPWQRTALTIPALMALVTPGDISFLSLLAVAGFYARIGFGQKNIRWSYISLGFLDWAIALLLLQYQLTTVLWYASLAGLSILYIAQFEPRLKSIQQKQNRHYLRLLGCGIIGVTALVYQTGLVSASIGLAFILAGIALSVRAYLFVGTSVFILTVLNQFVVFILAYAFLKWTIGLFVGVVLIAIAANFEQRRGVTVALQNWLAQLKRWE